MTSYVTRILFLTSMTIFLLSVSPIKITAKPLPVPSSQWDRETATWMARAWIAEAGWGKTATKRREQHAIGYVLTTRWHQMLKQYPRIRLVNVIRGYCAGLGETSRTTPRQLWVRNLGTDLEPEGWPRDRASWERHLPFWHDTRERVREFAQGKLANPCPGASFFGGLRAGDKPRGRMVRHPCSNEFEQQDVPGTTFFKLD